MHFNSIINIIIFIIIIMAFIVIANYNYTCQSKIIRKINNFIYLNFKLIG